MTNRTWMRAMGALLAVSLALALVACGSSSNNSSSKSSSASGSSNTAAQPGKGKPAVTLGDKNFTEEFILGELYAQALRAKGYTVNLKANIGSSEITDKALTSGTIDMYPEYTGTILSELAHQTRRPSSPQAAYQAAKQFEEGRGYTLLAPTPFADSDALAVLKTYGTKHNLHSVADLKSLNGKFTVGAPPEFRTRYEGLVGMKQAYGVTPGSFKPLSIGLQYKALDAGQVDTADVFTTDAQLQSGKYTLLSDPKFIFGFQNVAPVVKKSLLAKEGPAFAQTLDKVSALLTTDAMQRMNAAVALSQAKPADVAHAFLKANGLV